MGTETTKKTSAIKAAEQIIRDNGAPMHVKAITEKVLADFDTGLQGKTPVATIGAKLHGLAKKGETFVKVAPGTFGLILGASLRIPAPETEDILVESSEESPAVTPNAVVVRQGKQAKPDPKVKKTATKTAATKTARRAPARRAKAGVA